MSHRDVTDVFAGLTGSARRRAVDSAKEIARARNVAAARAALIRENARAIAAATRAAS